MNLLKFGCLLGILFAGNLKLAAQCNNPYYRLEKGRVLEMTTYDAGDQKTGKIVNAIQAVEQEGDAYVATFNSKIYDANDDLRSDGKYTIQCNNGIVSIDMAEVLPTSAIESFQNMKINFEGETLKIPAALEVGKSLPGSSMKATISPAGDSNNSQMGTSTINFFIKDRKVTDKTSVTTKAGTFECFVITYKTEMVMNIMGMERTMTFGSRDWITKDLGIIKTESYNGEGELTGYTMLTHYE